MVAGLKPRTITVADSVSLQVSWPEPASARGATQLTLCARLFSLGHHLDVAAAMMLAIATPDVADALQTPTGFGSRCYGCSRIQTDAAENDEERLDSVMPVAPSLCTNTVTSATTCQTLAV